MGFPTMYRARQRFEQQPAVPDLRGAVFAELERIGRASCRERVSFLV